MAVNPYTDIANAREMEATQYSFEDIIKATVRNAFTASGTKPLEKVSIALATIPAANPFEAQDILRGMIDDMVGNGEITSREGGTYKGMLTVLAKSSETYSVEV